MLLHRVLFFCFLIFGSTQLKAHEESGPWGCDPDPEKRVGAEFKPGIITLDGHADDWESVDGFEFSLLPALDPDQENEFKGGKMNIKVLFMFCYYNFILELCVFKFVMLIIVEIKV